MKFIFFVISALIFLLPPHPPSPPINFQNHPTSEIAVDWGVPDQSPVFNITDMLPGDTITRTITVKNGSSAPRLLSVKGQKTSEALNFSSGLFLSISRGSALIYGPGLLSDFFVDSATAGGVSLASLAGKSRAAFTFRVGFPAASGNNYQGARVVFDLNIGKLLLLPKSCRLSGYIFAGPADPDQIDITDRNHCSLHH